MTSPRSHSHVRGQTAFSRPATLPLESLAFVTDFGVAVFVFFLLLFLTEASLVPTLYWIPVLIAIQALLWLLQRFIIGTTLGEMAWALRFKAEEEAGLRFSRLRGNVFRQDGLNQARVGIAILLTLAIWGFSIAMTNRAYEAQPHWRVAESWKILPFLPSDLGNAEAGSIPVPGDAGEKWAITPFFYSLGAWPTTFQKKPVLYSIPYEKGPPTRFVGHIVARWNSPEIEVLFEGPKTPLLDGAQVPRREIQQCIGAPLWRAGIGHCSRIRDLVLRRHFEEMHASVDPQEWRLKWFYVENPALPPGEEVQGIYVHARGTSRLESRFILITPRGMHQSVILKGSVGPNGLRDDVLHAEKLIESSIGSLRVSDSLDAGRAWVDRELSSVRLDKLPDPGKSERYVLELARIQALLVSKISVDPKTFDTYYHLAGAAWLLIPSGAASGKSDWTAAAVPLLESLYRYAQDVLPADPQKGSRKNPRMAELENLWLEAKKFSGKKGR